MTLSHVAWKRIEVLGNRDDDGTRTVSLNPVDRNENHAYIRGFTIGAEDAYALAVALNQAADFALSKGDPTKVIPVVLTISSLDDINWRPGGINYAPFKSRFDPRT
jgi:hypothetical protein